MFKKLHIAILFCLWSILSGLFFPYVSYGIDETLKFYHYTNEDGLPSSYVKSIVQDTYGFIWLATRVSVSRFDGKNFQEFPVYDQDGNRVKIFCDRLFLSSDSVLISRTLKGMYYYFDDEQECFRPLSILNDLGATQAITPAPGGYWVCQNNKLVFLNRQNGEKEDLNKKFPFFRPPKDIGFLNILARKTHLVIMTNQNLLFDIDTVGHLVQSCQIPAELGPYQTDLYYLDTGNHAWIGQFDYGLACIDMKDGRYHFYSTNRREAYHLPHNMVHCMTEDQQGRVWIGTEGGLAVHDPETDMLKIYNSNLFDPTGLNTDPIYAAYCDKQGNVWLGTYFGGINFWSGEKKIFHNWSSGLGKWQLRGNVVSSLDEDKTGNLWIGLEDNGLDRINMKTGNVTHYSSDDGPNSLSYNNLHDLLFVSEYELWLSSYTGGINILNTKTNKFTYFNRSNTPELTSDAIYAFMLINNSVFVASSGGIAVYDLKRKSFSRLKPDLIGSTQFESIAQTEGTLWFSSSKTIYCYKPAIDSLYAFDRIPEMTNINFVKTDSRGNIWIGDCYKGLCRYNEKDKSITYFNTDTGFPASWIFSMEEGMDGWFWASSDKGLVKFSPDKGIQILYDSNSGIPFNQFNYRASFKDHNGNIYFGGNNGMVSFNEVDYSSEVKKMNTVFTGMQLFNKPVHPGDGRYLEHSINKTKEIILDYDQNVFTLEYTSFCYSSKGRCQYAYYLEGFENSWNYVGNRNFATYTNLSPGSYIFHVKGSLGDIQTETTERVLKIIVRPPFWLTKWAFAGYFLLACLFSFLVFKVGKNLEKSKAMVVMERREKEHSDEIHKVKLEFFTNISHELKTPLTLILGPLSRLMEEEKLSPAFRKCLIGIDRNANRLFQLINQLLEFRKIENGKENLKVGKCDLRTLMTGIANSFENEVEARDIDFKIYYPQKDLSVWLDEEKVDKIIFNLLSNAFKFTKEGGKIELSADLVKQDGRSGTGYNVIISVSDSGKGIRQEMLDKVFDRFFQIEDDHSRHEGSGIGLAFVKSLVILHKGEIKVDSILNKGSVFTVKIPASRSDYSDSEIAEHPMQYISSSESKVNTSDPCMENNLINAEGLSRKHLILLVEDNIELINFMKETLELKYQVITALNGAKALEKISGMTPDLIISDIMMPEMDGFEFTQRIKTDLRTSHIPVILLTSKSGAENRLAGLMTGADYYIEKPFYPNILEQNIENILQTRQRLIERFKNDAFVQVGEMAHSESDKVFIEKLTAIIRSNISDPDMDVSFLIKQMGISRSLLHMKLKGLVGCSSTEFIRAIRLKEAVKLIATGKCNISEAAYETGFSSPTYFTRRFREFYGKSPREYFNG